MSPVVEYRKPVLMLTFVLTATMFAAACTGGGSQATSKADNAAMSVAVTGNRQSLLQPGQATPVIPVANPLDETKEDILAEGGELYRQFNCSGCHFAGGGGIGPPLMDDQWIYGSSAGNIYWTVVEGRPQGMPAFGGRIQAAQLWRIAAYVRSLSGLHKRTESASSKPSPRTVSGK